MNEEAAPVATTSEAAAVKPSSEAAAAKVDGEASVAEASVAQAIVAPTSVAQTSSEAAAPPASGEAASAKRGFFRKILRGLDGLVAGVVIAAMAGMTIVVAAQVFLRYGLNESLDWADEVSRLLFVWSVFLAIPLGIGRGVHVALELLTDRIPTALHTVLYRCMNILAIVLMGIVSWQATQLTIDQWDEPMATLEVSVGLFMLPLSIGAVHSVLHLLASIVDGPPAKTISVTE